MELIIPNYVIDIQNRLKNYNYECYLVGGCVRDSILGNSVKDYDLNTNCDIDTIKQIFNDYPIINNNGEKHQTITLHVSGDNVEITSYKHADNEPNSLYSDLSHRDITINAMAYDNEVIDYYGGLNDLHNKIIRCVGNPIDRIKEDPLRILRILRFCSKLNFKIEKETSDAIHKTFHLLKGISKERIKAELDGILIGNNLKYILTNYRDVLFEIIPELKETYGFEQHNPYHTNDVFTHITNVCCNTENNTILRIAALLHDIGKPKCFTIDENNIGHFYGHPIVSYDLSLNILKRLKYSNEEIEKITYLIKYHDSTILINKKSIRKNFSNTPNHDEELFMLLIKLKNADSSDHTIKELMDEDSVRDILNQIKQDNECLKITDLDIDGYDMMELGYKGKEIKDNLNNLLDAVLEEKVDNTKEELIKYLKENA